MIILSQKVIAKWAESTTSQHTLKLESLLPNLGQDSQLQQKPPWQKLVALPFAEPVRVEVRP